MWLQLGPFADTEGTTASGPIVAVRGPACERQLRRISDVPTNLLELNSGADVFGEAGAVHQTMPVQPDRVAL